MKMEVVARVIEREPIPLFGLIGDIQRICPGVIVMPMYEGYFAEFYSKISRMQSADVQWFHTRAGRSSSVLDLCGGNGRIATWLTAAGGTALVVDQSSDMLAQAVSDASMDVEYRIGDVLKLSLGKRFERVACGGLAYPMFDSCQRAQLLATVSNHLAQGGVFFFDYLPAIQGEKPCSHYATIPLLDGASGYILSGVQRDPIARVQRTSLMAELDQPGSRTVRLATGHELALLERDEVAFELSLAGLEILEEEDYYPPTQSTAVSWPMRFVAARATV